MEPATRAHGDEDLERFEAWWREELADALLYPLGFLVRVHQLLLATRA